MIESREELKRYLAQDKKALRITRKKTKLFGDYIWRFEIRLRKTEFYVNCRPKNKFLYLYSKYKLDILGKKCGFNVPINSCGAGLALVHMGTVIINGNSKVGENCRIHTGVTLGSTNGSGDAPSLGNNIFLGDGCKIIGGIKIADDVAIGANAVVVKDIDEPGTTWGGVPAHKISNNNSHKNLSPFLFETDG